MSPEASNAYGFMILFPVTFVSSAREQPVKDAYARLMRDSRYSRQEPSRTQRFFMWLMRGRAANVERESREWFVTCPNCGLERTYWDLGGVRYKAWSRRKRTGLRCPSCGKWSMHPVERRTGSATR